MLKSDVRVYDAKITLLEDVMNLPVALVEGTKEVKDFIKELEEKYGQSADTRKTQS